jgi:hypothetical protein
LIHKSSAMKTSLKIRKYLLTALGIGGCAIIVSCITNSGRPKGKVEITANGILIHPTIHLSAADQKNLDDTLKNFGKSLYKIVTLKKGRVTQVRGRLADAKIDATLKSEVAEAQKAGADDHTEQFVHVSGVAVRREVNDEANELIKRIQPILEKYR